MKRQRIPQQRLLSIWLLACATLAFAAVPPQQTPAPVFDAVSIRQVDAHQTVQTASGPVSMGAMVSPCVYSRDRVICQLSLRALIKEAFHLKDYEISGLEWLENSRYAVQATTPLDTGKDAARQMLQTALAERFALKFHYEKKVLPVYELVPGKHGLHLEPAGDPAHQVRLNVPTPAGQGASVYMRAGQFFAMAISMDGLANYLQGFGALDVPVVNRTGAEGQYTFDLHWTPTEDMNSLQRGKDPEFTSAVEAKYGLKLNKTTAAIDIMVIDSVERIPAEN